jgi:Fic-DOC domain mobile mystery protein B
LSYLFEPPDDHATPLTAEERRDLILGHIAFRHELNLAEQENIVRAEQWAQRRRGDLLSEEFIRNLHRQMFDEVWRWAGRFRTSQRNIGIDYWQIPVALRALLDDAKSWIETTAYARDEMAVRLHHRLVLIHPFANGNGRHARLMADLLVMRLGGSRFSWGRGDLRDASRMRRRYIDALRAADRHDIAPLLDFARSLSGD